ncbi:hypothetical protein AGR7B_Lc100047 [Agrobacterium deltaense RV3]|nr:hypothetical protein AGR7B_Lc100047 [Agrobacterium deltaense RV3]
MTGNLPVHLGAKLQETRLKHLLAESLLFFVYLHWRNGVDDPHQEVPVQPPYLEMDFATAVTQTPADSVADELVYDQGQRRCLSRWDYDFVKICRELDVGALKRTYLVKHKGVCEICDVEIADLFVVQEFTLNRA